jgi:copper chaperone CopZ
MEHLTLSIDGMSCGHCLNAVNRALRALPDVTVRSVAIGRAEVDYDPARMDPTRIVAAIADAGYSATPRAA